MRTPITGIVGVAELLLEEKEHGEFPDQELKMIKESADTILGLIDEVLAGINSDSHNGERKKEENPLNNIVDQLKRLYGPPARVKQLSLTFNNLLASDFKIPHSFSLKLLQIVSNLVSNAVKFTPEKGMLEVTISPASGENDLQITVANSGSHMSANQVKAFNNGNSLERSFGTNGEQSFGVGLKYVRQMVENAEGTISVQSEKNNGTQFTITLPKPVESTVAADTSLPENLKNTMSN